MTEESSKEQQVVTLGDSESDDDVEYICYRIGEPFKKLEKLMFGIHDNKIMKRVIQLGHSANITEGSIVTFKYKAYAELKDVPFDTTYKSGLNTISITKNHYLPGLSAAIQSMKVGEISQFLLRVDLAYGDGSWLFSIEPDNLALFIVHIKSVINCDKDELFKNICAVAHALCKKGNQLYLKGLFKPAVSEFHDAILQLERAPIDNNTDFEKQRQFLLRLYTNLVITHTKLHNTQQVFSYSKKVYGMCSGTLKVPTKVYINHARSLVFVSEFKEAEELLRTAEQLEPSNQDLATEIFKLRSTMKIERRPIQMPSLASIALRPKVEEVSKEFKDATTQHCLDILKDEKGMEYELPNNFTKAEHEFVLSQVRRYKLHFKETKVDGVTRYFVSKKSSFKTK